MRIPRAYLGLLLLPCLLLLPAAASAAAPVGCAGGPQTFGGTTHGTPCDDVIVAAPGVAAVSGGGGDDTIVAAPIAASAPCPTGCHLGVGSQTFDGGPGDDVVYGERGNDTLRGGEGNDHLFGGIGDDLLRGGPGNDRLGGGFGADSIDGEAGDDYIHGDGTIDRIADTGGGADTLSYATGVTPGFGGSVGIAGFPPASGERGLRLDLGAGGQNANNGVAPHGGGVDEVDGQGFETVIGTPFSDYIAGTAAAETIYGGGGADAILGGGGGDSLDGGADGDYLDGGTAVPRDATKVSVGLMAPPGATGYSQLYAVGGSGDDDLTATYAPGPPATVNFALSAGSFDLTPAAAAGCSVASTLATCPLAAPLDSIVLAGMGGSDTLAVAGFPDSATVVILGGEEGDALTGAAGEEVLVDGEGDADDQLSAFGGDDALLHNGGEDQRLGGDGNDLFLSVSVCDADTLVGGPGRDNASWARLGEGVGASLERGEAGRPGSGETPSCATGAPDLLAEIEDLEGSSFADRLYGDSGPNQLLGHPGEDVYFAAAGDDSLLANSGDRDPEIDCGDGTADSAIVDRPQYEDAAPIGCETVREADPNSFQIVPGFPTPIPVAPSPNPPKASPPAKADTRPPQTRLLARPPRLVTAKSRRARVRLRFGSNEPGSRFRCRLDRRAYAGCTSPRAYFVTAGRHAVRVVAIDRAGNADPTPAVGRFRVLHRP